MSRRASTRVAVAKPRNTRPPAKAKARAATARDDKEYDIEEILDERHTGAKIMYFVSWVGHGPQHNCWIEYNQLGYAGTASKFEASRRAAKRELIKDKADCARALAQIGQSMITEAAKAAKVSRGHESVAAAPWCKFATDKRKINVGCPRYMFAKLPRPRRYLKKLPHGWEFATASDFADWINMFQLYTRTDVGQMREPSVYVPWSPCSTTRYTIAAGGENHHGARIYLLATLDAPEGQAQRFKIFQGGDDAEATYVHESDDPPVSISDPIVFTVGANGIATVRFCVAALDLATDDNVSHDEFGPPEGVRSSKFIELSLAPLTAKELVDRSGTRMETVYRKLHMFDVHASPIQRRLESALAYVMDNVPCQRARDAYEQQVQEWGVAMDRFKWDAMASRYGWFEQAANDDQAAKEVNAAPPPAPRCSATQYWITRVPNQ